MTNDKLKEALRESAMGEFLNIDKQCETILWEPSEQLNAEMETLFNETKKRRKPAFKRMLLVAAVILLISLMTVFGVAKVRNKVINYFTHQSWNHFDVDYGYDEPGDIPTDAVLEEIYLPSELPDGFEQISQDTAEHVASAVFENENGDSIILLQGDGITTRGIDNERLSKSYVFLNGLTVEAYAEEGYVLLLWNTEKYTFSVDYYGPMDAETLAHAVIDNLVAF